MKNKLDTLTKLLQEIRDTSAEASLDELSFPYQTRAGIEMRKRTAIGALPNLKVRYGKELIKTVHKVVVNADKDTASKLADLLVKEGVVATAADTVYDYLTDRIEKQLDGRMFTGGSYIQLMENVALIARRHNIGITKEIKPLPPQLVNTREELYSLIKNFVEANYNTSLNEAYIVNNLIEQGLEKEFNKEALVLIVPEMSSKLDSLLAGQTSIHVQLDQGEEVGKSIALKIFRKVSESINKQSIKTNKE